MMMMEMLTTKHVLSRQLKNFPKGILWAGGDDMDLSINNSLSENENKEENDWVKVPQKS